MDEVIAWLHITADSASMKYKHCNFGIYHTLACVYSLRGHLCRVDILFERAILDHKQLSHGTIEMKVKLFDMLTVTDLQAFTHKRSILNDCLHSAGGGVSLLLQNLSGCVRQDARGVDAVLTAPSHQ